ncbi:hypothetical protein FIV42_17555 [Persicimonas caeni]|uniref:Uncharacterized protein n=1 Tax=Persicimonas caeni TaxID=2292766 RepID=A0A4Y6PWT1_PERCE|nr:hypothetical protein [Persicimonas caeni]QDG52477.1 hypothetical protein FIV42_17555 [Persicimonas caeni]QED33699.1 hypothetical protein FRD00_17550 [Persicimonas caeni]
MNDRVSDSLNALVGPIANAARPFSSVLDEEDYHALDWLEDVAFGTLSYLEKGKVPEDREERIRTLEAGAELTSRLLANVREPLELRASVAFVEMVRVWVLRELLERRPAE